MKVEIIENRRSDHVDSLEPGDVFKLMDQYYILSNDSDTCGKLAVQVPVGWVRVVVNQKVELVKATLTVETL